MAVLHESQELPTYADEYATGLSLSRKLVLAIEILGVYGRVRWMLWRTEVPVVLATLRQDVVAPAGAERVLAAHRIARAVVRVLEWLPSDARCLTRSLVLIRALARTGIGASLVIGVTPEPTFAAHAWVELGGRPLLPPYEGTYSRLVEL